jgi:endonuclease/exonuclease/phosphatase family metal-dependent hydrolase
VKANVDLVALQEVDNRTERHPIDEATTLSTQTGMHVFFERARYFQGGDYGVAILSRFPILKQHTFHYHTPSAWHPNSVVDHQCREQQKNDYCQVAIAVLVQTANERLWFACTHIVTASMGNSLVEAQQLVYEFVPQLVQIENVPVVIGGDFNASPDSDVIRTVLQDGKAIDLWHHCHNATRDPHGYTFSALKPRSRIDYLFEFNSKQLRRQQSMCELADVINSDASDHLPLRVRK